MDAILTVVVCMAYVVLWMHRDDIDRIDRRLDELEDRTHG